MYLGLDLVRKHVIEDNWFGLLHIIDQELFISLMGADNAFYVLILELLSFGVI